MKRSNKIFLVLATFFHVLAIGFIALSIFGFFPDLWKRWIDILVLIILCELLIEVLLSINKHEKKDKNYEFKKEWKENESADKEDEWVKQRNEEKI